MKLTVLSLCLTLVAARNELGGRTSGQTGGSPADAHKRLAKCRMEGGDMEACKAQVERVTGVSIPDGRSSYLDALRGRGGAIADLFGNRSCRQRMQECLDQAKDAVKRMSGRDMEDEEVANELMQVGASKARDIIYACLGSATTREEKTDCLSSPDAIKAAKDASGRGRITKADLIKFMEDGVESESFDILVECRENAATDEEKKACANGGGMKLKDALANARGKDSTDIMDSEVRELLQKSARKDAYALLKLCSASKQECLEQGKRLKALAEGRDESDVTDEMMELDAKKAASQDLADQMEACVEEADGNRAKIKECRKVLAEAAGKHLGKRSKIDEEEMIRDAGKNKAREVSETCFGSRSECMERIRERASKSMGKLPEDLTIKDLEELNKAGAVDAAKEAAKACRDAKRADASASCQDPALRFLKVRRIEATGNQKKDSTKKKAILQDVAKELNKDAMTICLERPSRDEVTACMSELSAETDDVAVELFGDVGEKVKANKMKRAKQEAAVEAVGERFHLCMKAAGDSTSEKDLCKEELEKKTSLAGLTESAEKVTMRHRRNSVANAARACSATEREKCLRQVKQDLQDAGMAPRAFGVVKKLAQVRAAAEDYAACKEADYADDACLEVAKATLEVVSGGLEGVWSDDTAMRIKKLGKAVFDGIATKLVKSNRLDFMAETTEDECRSTSRDELMNKVDDLFEDFMSSVMKRTMDRTSDHSRVMRKVCHIIFGSAEYGSKIDASGLSETDMPGVADFILQSMNGFDLSGRRLSRVSEAFADQDVNEVADEADGSGSTSSGFMGRPATAAAPPLKALLPFPVMATLVLM